MQAVNDDDPVVSILTEGHTIEAIANQLRDSRIQDTPERPSLFMEGVNVGSPDSNADTGDEPPGQATLPTVFKWEGGGKEVVVIPQEHRGDTRSKRNQSSLGAVFLTLI